MFKPFTTMSDEVVEPRLEIKKLLKGKRVMIVDDTIFNILALKLFLAGIPELIIYEAFNGKLAVELFKDLVSRDE